MDRQDHHLPQSNVKSALHLMRRANSKIRTDIPKTVPLSVEKARNLHITLNNPPPPIVLHDVSVLYREAYVTVHKIDHLERAYKAKPMKKFRGLRQIEPELVSEIVQEEDAKRHRAAKLAQRLRKQVQQAWQEANEDRDDNDVDEAYDRHSMFDDFEIIDRSSSHVRPQTAPSFDLGVLDGYDVSKPYRGIMRGKSESNLSPSGRPRMSQRETSINVLCPTSAVIKTSQPEQPPAPPPPVPKKPKVVLTFQEKKKMREEKQRQAELTARAKLWYVAAVHFTRVNIMMQALAKERYEKAAQIFQSSQRYAARYIERWWIDHRLTAKMKRNTQKVNWIRTLTMNMWRKIKVERLNKHADVLKKFCRDVAGCSDRTKKLYRYRSRVIKLQRYIRSYLEIQRARLQILFLSLQKLIHKIKVERNRQKHRSENASVRKMKNSRDFGSTVQKLDEINNQITALHISQSKARKKKADALTSTTGTYRSATPGGVPSSPVNTHSFARYRPLLLDVLAKQRRRHQLSLTERRKRTTNRFYEPQYVNPDDVKAFLMTPGHDGLALCMEAGVLSRARVEPFLLLTAGALKELEYLAMTIVLEDERRSLERALSLSEFHESTISSTNNVLNAMTCRRDENYLHKESFTGDYEFT